MKCTWLCHGLKSGRVLMLGFVYIVLRVGDHMVGTGRQWCKCMRIILARVQEDLEMR